MIRDSEIWFINAGGVRSFGEKKRMVIQSMDARELSG
jgi:hypothetical protein